MCVSGRFACEVSGVEFLQGCLDLVEVEHDVCRYSVLAVELDDAERLAVERLGSFIVARPLRVTEDKASATGRNCVCCPDHEGPDFARGPPFGDDGILTSSQAAVHD